jgi:hypothetical protein
LVASAAASAAAACALASQDPASTQSTSTESAALLSDPATQSVLGFESLSGWSIASGPGTLSLSTTHTQGADSLQVASPGYTVLQSQKLSTLGSVGSTLLVDYQLPGTLGYGSLALTINSPTLGLYNDWIAQVDVSNQSGGTFRTATFTLPANVVTLLASSYSDLSIGLIWNVPANAGNFLLDNIRFPNATTSDAGVDAAKDSSTTDSAPDGGAAGDGSISPALVFAKPNFKEITVNDVVPNRTFNPQGVVVDRNAKPNVVYVFDSTNQRILGFKSLGTCTTSGATCTSDADCASGQSCTIQSGPTRNADMVFGQPDFTSTTCNGDDTSVQPATSSTLCTQPFPRAVSILESGDSQSMAVDSQRNLYVLDKWNHRVLRYNSPPTSDNVADMVWGQPNMTSRLCNGSTVPTAPTQSSLCLNAEAVNGSTGAISGDEVGGGVEALADGSIWVTDVGNNRVLRFPPNSTLANMVLGQPDYLHGTADPTECDPHGTTNTGTHICNPKTVRYNAATKQLYVVDWKLSSTGSNKYRVLIYTPKGSNGDFAMDQQADTWILGDPWFDCTTNLDVNGNNTCPGSLVDGGIPEPLGDVSFQWNRPAGLELPLNQAANAFWLADAKNGRVVSYAEQGGKWTAVQAIGQQNGVSFNGVPNCPSGDQCQLGAPSGSMGMDSAGNIYVADENSEEVLRFGTAHSPTIDGGTETAWPANEVMFPTPAGAPAGSGLDNNAIDAYGAFSLNKVKLINYPSGGTPQLVLFDQFRLLFWNSYSGKSSGSAADGVLYQTDFNSNLPPADGNALNGLDSDSKGNVFVGHGSQVDVFPGPLTKFQTAMVTSFNVSTVPLRTGGTLTSNSDGLIIQGLAYDEKNNALFVADVTNFRVLRIATPLVPSTRQIDLVLGQSSATAVNPNRSHDPFHDVPCVNVQPDGFGHTSQIKLDASGNLYVVDAQHEGWDCSNNRVVEYDAASLVPGTTDFFCGVTDSGCTTARRPTRYFVSGNPSYPQPAPDGGAPLPIGQQKGSGGGLGTVPNAPIGVAFDANGHMIMVLDGYEGNGPTQRVFYYATPLPSCSSNNPGCYVKYTSIFPSMNSQPTDVSFDSSGNLVVMDQTWARVLYYTAASYASWVATQPTQ